MELLRYKIGEKKSAKPPVSKKPPPASRKSPNPWLIGLIIVSLGGGIAYLSTYAKSIT